MSDIDPFLYEDVLDTEFDLGDPPGEDDEEEEEDGVRDWVTAESCANAQPPWLTELYDVTRDDLNVKVSTEKANRAIWKLVFEFQKTQGRTPGYHGQFGLCLYATASFTKENGGDDSKFDEHTVLLFFKFLRQKRTTTGNLNKAVSFLNSHLKGEFYARLRHVGYTPLKVSKASVGKLTAVKNCITASRAEKADKEWEDQLELLDDIDKKFDKPMVTELINCAYKEQPPGALTSMTPLLKVQFAAAFTFGMQTGRRGEESYRQKVVQRFVRKVEYLGVRGTLCGYSLTNKSKRNNVSRREYTTTAPHVDPRKDTSANHGAMWMYRFVVMKEPLPNFLDYTTCYNVPTFRKVKSIANMSGDSFRDMFKQFFVANLFLGGKVTHQCRREVEQMLDDLGCQPENIARMCGHAFARTFQEEHRNGTLRSIFLEQAFLSQEYLNFRRQVRSLEDQIHSVHVSQPQELAQDVRGSTSDALSQLVGVVAALKAEVHALAHKVDRLEQTSRISAVPGNPSAAGATTSTISTAEILPLDPQENNRRYRQEEILRAEEPTAVLRTELKDSGENTFDGYIDTYLNEYLRLEKQGIEWRVDRKVLDTKGNEYTPSSRAKFWSRRRPLYSLYEIFKEQNKRSQPDNTDEDADKFARRKGAELFQKSKTKNKNETFQNLKRAWKDLTKTAEGQELYDNTFLGQQTIKKAKFSSVDQPQEQVAQAASQEEFHVQRQQQNNLTNPHQHCPGAPALTRGHTSIEQRQNCAGRRPVNVGRRVTPMAAAPDAFQQAFGILPPEEMQQVLEARSQYHQSPTPSERDAEADALAEYQRAQREKQPGQERRQRAAADRRGMEQAKQTHGCYYSRQHNLHVRFPEPGWQPPASAIRTVPLPLHRPRPLHGSLSEFIAADRPQLPQFPPGGPITNEMVIYARNQRWSEQPELGNGTRYLPRRESFFPPMQEGYKGPSIAEREFDEQGDVW